MCQALGLPEVVTDPRFEDPWERSRNAEALTALFEERFQTRTTREWLDFLIEADIPCALVQDYAAVAEDAQVLANRYIDEIDHPVLGPLRVPGVPIHMTGTPPRRPGPAPELGQNTEEVLLDLGYTWEQIESLRTDAVI